VPEGDSLVRAARRLQVLVGETLEVEAPHPRAAVKRVAERLHGRRLLAVEAAGKNLLLRFDDGVVLRSHLRMSGRWTLHPKGAKRVGRPWLVLRGSEREAALWNGPVLELDETPVRRLGPDILADSPELDRMLANLRREPQRAIGDTLLDQRLLAGIGNRGGAQADGCSGRDRQGPPRRLPPRRAPLPPVRRADSVAWAGRRQPHRLLVPFLSEVGAEDRASAGNRG
jgi:endonuclease-8